jgi:O-antigen ligase
MTSTPTGIERAGFWLLIASLGLVQFNLLAGQVAFGLAALTWLRLVISERSLGPLPGFFGLLVGYAIATLASAAGSFDPRASLIDSKQLVLFLMVPLVMRLARGPRAMLALDVIMAVGAAGALLGVIESTMLGFDHLGNRPTGSLTHYMTYSGVIMLILSAAVARLLFYPDQRVWPGIAIPALAAALALTLTRNAWIGALAATTCLLALRQPRLALVVPALVLVAVVAAPAGVRDRALSIFDPNDPSNRDRVQMLGMGVQMVRDHPLLGVGPDMVKEVYPRYRPPDAVHPTNPHLHNVPMQIAAERGLPALVLWLGFVSAAFVGLLRLFRASEHRSLAAAGLAAVVAMFSAGLFEYNFGDSEFLMLFLGLISLAFAASLRR